jgi:16S rRNA (cytosine967-C5)-methyltransferase
VSEANASNGGRAIAARVLTRVWEDRAHAAAVLDAEIQRAGERDVREAGLATELTYGVLRMQGYLEETGRSLSSRGTLIDHYEARAHLLIALYSISFLDRIPVFAAVSEGVAGIKRLIGEKPANFANAILRAHALTIEKKGRPDPKKTILESTPSWLKGALRGSLGRREALDFLTAGAESPPLHLAVADAKEREAILARLRAYSDESGEPPEQQHFEPTRFSPHGIIARAVAHPRSLPGFEREWIVQEEGAQLVALALGAQPGDAVLDACAGRGNKSWLLSQQVGPSGKVTLVDKYPAKLAAFIARGEAKSQLATHALDLTVGIGELTRESFDRVLVDAPCSGIGTLRRRPEIGLHREEADLAELAALQLAITQRASGLLRPGGTLVYAVCSVLKAECEDVLARLLETEPLEPLPLKGTLPEELVAENHTLRLLPNKHGTDGFFLAAFRRR